jgi:hypothetical protein
MAARAMATASAEPTGKVCVECKVRKSADSTQFFCTSLTRDQLSERCRHCVLAGARRERLARDARSKNRPALTSSRACRL